MVAWLRSFSSRLPVYIYPLTLVGIEFLLRQLALLETKTFIGPTLASIGVSFLLPLTSKKTLTLEKWKKFPPAIAQKIEDLQN